MALTIDLSGKIALVTGAGRGLGRAIALALADAGAQVALAARSADQLDSVADEIRGAGHKAIAIPTDVTQEDQVANMVAKTLEGLGGLHIVVNNAGIERQAPLLKSSQTDWDTVMAVNLRSMFLVSKAAGPTLIEQKWGRVLNMASVGGTIAAPNNGSYHASKAGAILFTKSLALEWARYNITVNALAPGYFETDMLNSLMQNEDLKNKVAKVIPAHRYGDPAELGPLSVYLCSELSSYITGQAIIIDGGLSAT